MNAGEHDFLASARRQPGNLRNNLVRRPAAQDGPYFGDDAKAAIEETAVLYLHEGAAMVVETRDAGWRIGHAELAQSLGDSGLVGNHFGDARQTGHRVRVARREAAHDHNSRPRVLLGQPANKLPT